MKCPKTGVGGVGGEYEDPSHIGVDRELAEVTEGDSGVQEPTSPSRGPERERHGISQGQNECHEEGSGQYDFNTPTLADRLWVGPDAVTASNPVDRARVDTWAPSAPPPFYSKEELNGIEHLNHHTTNTMVKSCSVDVRVADLKQKLDHYAATLRAWVPPTLADAVALAGRLAEVEALRHVLDAQDEKEGKDNLLPSYMPAWEHALLKNSQHSLTLDIIACDSLSTHMLPAPQTVDTMTTVKVPYDLKVYTDPEVGRAYSKNRKEDFRRYREERGLTTYSSRISSWWRSILNS